MGQTSSYLLHTISHREESGTSINMTLPLFVREREIKDC